MAIVFGFSSLGGGGALAVGAAAAEVASAVVLVDEADELETTGLK